jgi:DNA-binding transcriptional ArsR family regulator
MEAMDANAERTNDEPRSHELGNDELTRAAGVFHALGNEHRLRILAHLRERGMHCASEHDCAAEAVCCDVAEVARELGISVPTVSYHLRELREAGVVSVAKRGRRVACRLDTGELHRALAYVARVAEPGSNQSTDSRET